MTFNLPPPTCISNMFGRWLNAMEKSLKSLILVDSCAICWSIWNCRNDLVFNRKFPIYAGDLLGGVLAPYLIPTASDGGQGFYEFWVQPYGDGRTGFLQPVWVARRA